MFNIKNVRLKCKFLLFEENNKIIKCLHNLHFKCIFQWCLLNQKLKRFLKKFK